LLYQAKARRPYVTYILLFISVGAYLVEWNAGGEEWVLTHLAQERVKVWEGQYWRLFTAIFIHHTMVSHVAMNMLALLALGRVIERVLGSGRFLLLYLASGLAGSLFFQAFSEGAGPALGASGAVYGVFGALALVLTSRTAIGELVPRWKFPATLLFVVAADQVVAYGLEFGGAGVSLAVSAHLGGLVAGSALGYVLTPRPLGSTPRVRRLQMAVASAFVLSVSAVGVYGCVLRTPAADLRSWIEVRALEVQLQERNFERAFELWYGLRTRDRGLKQGKGLGVYDGLMSIGKQDLAEKALNELIASALAALMATDKQSPQRAQCLNEVAWLCGQRGTDLQQAKDFAIEAVGLAREARSENVWLRLFPGAPARLEESLYLNTLGWVELQLAEYDLGITHLEEAADLVPMGANLLYLALGHDVLGQTDAAREVAGQARLAGDLTLYETRLLEELQQSLGEF
jgi:rhomboid protease GluP